ncbi:MAG TPA: hypothetical protein VM690_05250, partial [Gaiellaceae bacterium]|nr:hypothetical protein [Gaiellaceae bacterium]
HAAYTSPAMNATGPLVARWLTLERAPVEAGARQHATVELANAGTAPWRTLRLAYHWLDDRGNPIVWDGERTPLARTIDPGETVRHDIAIRGPIPPGRYRLAVDLVQEGRFWLAELGNDPLEEDVDVVPRDPRGARAFLPEDAEPAADWHDRVRDLHAQGYAAVGGAVAARRPSAGLAPYAPGGGRHPRFPHPLVCPSLLPPLEPNDEIDGLPAYRPEGDEEPWMFDGRIVLRLRSRSGRRRG